MNEGLKLKDSPQVRESGKRLLVESGIPLRIGINQSSTEKHWNPVPGIRNSRCGIQNPRLSWSSYRKKNCYFQERKGMINTQSNFLVLLNDFALAMVGDKSLAS